MNYPTDGDFEGDVAQPYRPYKKNTQPTPNKKEDAEVDQKLNLDEMKLKSNQKVSAYHLTLEEGGSKFKTSPKKERTSNNVTGRSTPTKQQNPKQKKAMINRSSVPYRELLNQRHVQDDLMK